MPLFFGRIQGTVDARGRVTVPARYRELLPDGHVVFVPDPDGCLRLYTEAGFRQMRSDFANRTLTGKNTPLGEADRAFERAILAAGEVQALDAKGRIHLSEASREHAGIEREVVFLGAADHLEIWNPGRLAGDVG